MSSIKAELSLAYCSCTSWHEGRLPDNFDKKLSLGEAVGDELAEALSDLSDDLDDLSDGEAEASTSRRL